MSQDESDLSAGSGADSIEHPEADASGDYVETLRKPGPHGEPDGHSTFPKPDATSSEEADVPRDWNPGESILGQYDVLAELGHGGFGVVHKVHHKGWNVDMAVKSAGYQVSEEDVFREAEVWMELGLHPNIASCYFVRNLGGIPRIFVEYVSGGTLHEWLYGEAKEDEDGNFVVIEKPRELTRAQRLAIAIEICRGMHHTHSFQWKDKEGKDRDGVVHRDLKPLNILMTEEGIPRVTDFGLVGIGLPAVRPMAPDAASEVRDGQEATPLPTLVKHMDITQEGVTLRKPSEEESPLDSSSGYLDPAVGASRQRLCGGKIEGTPQYMAPEQWDEHAPSTKASDIYAFGVILYELYCGKYPFQASGGGWRYVHLYQPPKDPRSEDYLPDLDAQLANLMLQCLEKTPEDRPASFAEIRDQLKAIRQRLEGDDYDTLHPEPKAAELLADSLNNRALSYLEMGQPERAEQLWREALEADPLHLESTYNFGIRRFREAKIDTGNLLGALLFAMKDASDKHRASILHLRALIECDSCHPDILERAGNRAGLDTSRPDYEDVRRLWVTRQAFSRHCLGGFELGHGVRSISISASGLEACSGYEDGKVRLWDISTSTCLRTIEAHEGAANNVCFSADGEHALSGGQDGSLRMWNLESGKCVRMLTVHQGSLCVLQLTRDGHNVVCGMSDGTLQHWDLAKGKHLRTLAGHTGAINAVSLSSDGTTALSGGADKSLRLWDLSSGVCVRTCAGGITGHQESITCVYLSKDCTFALSAGCDGTLRRWNLDDDTCRALPLGRIGRRVFRLSVDEDEKRVLLVAEYAVGIDLWSLSPPGHIDNVSWGQERPTQNWYVCFTQGASRAVSLDRDGRLRVWQVGSPEPWHAPFEVSVPASTASAVTVDIQFDIYLQEANSKLDAGHPLDAVKLVRDARDLSGCSKRLEAIALWQNLYQCFPRKSLRGVWLNREHEGRSGVVECVLSSLTIDGRFLFAAIRSPRDFYRNPQQFWCRGLPVGGKVLPIGAPSLVFAVTVSPDGQYGLSGHQDGAVRIWDLSRAEPVSSFTGADSPVTGVYTDGSFRVILGGCSDGTICIWHVATRRLIDRIRHGTDTILGFRSSPDERQVYVIRDRKQEGCIEQWDLARRTPLRSFGGPASLTGRTSIDISPDGRYALLLGDDKGGEKVRLWDLELGCCVHTVDGYTGCFTKDGRFTIIALERSISVWRIEDLSRVAEFQSGGYSAPNLVRVSTDVRYLWLADRDGRVSEWVLDWDLEEREPSDWDPGVQPYLKNFLALHVPYALDLPLEREPSRSEITRALTREGRPTWTDDDFQQLLYTLGCAGYGWLRPEGVRKELEKMAATWTGPPPLPGG